MEYLIVGDVHGYHKNLRSFLRSQNVIDKKGNRINQDTTKVYCAGDLIDGVTNRQGDLLNLEFAPKWFDAVCLGNHEMAFVSSESYSGKRRADRKLLDMILRLIDDEIFVPAVYVPAGSYGDFLITHAGFSEYFGFDNAADAYEYIKVMWEIAPVLKEEIAVFDWQGPIRSSGYGDPTGGIFELDWGEDRNTKFNQVSGHTIKSDGPIHRLYEKDGSIHWNVDVGGKHGKALGALLIDDVAGTVEPIFWGERSWTGSTVWNATTQTWDKKHDSSKVSTLKNGEVVYPGYKRIADGVWEKDAVKLLAEGESTKFVNKNEQTQFSIVEGYDGESMVNIKKKHEQNGFEHTNFKTIPITDLDDTDIALINDPEILDVYRDECERGFQDKLGKNILH